MKVEALENVKDQIGFCGIWCGSCVVGNGALVELTKRYEEIIIRYSLEEWAPKDFDFKEFMKGLSSIKAMSLCLGCLEGDGRPNCEMRNCASKKKIADCSECDQLTTCKNLETLEKMRTGARRAGLLVRIRNAERQKLIDNWAAELRARWPSCIILCPSTRDNKHKTQLARVSTTPKSTQ